jgi:uncharacterized membrane protein
MDPVLREVLDLALRWVHVVAGILWIGNSMLWNWLDRELVPPEPRREGVAGEIWLLHSGAFYRMEKDLRGWDRARPLHWFRWQAYTTWLTGAALLAVVYHAGGRALLVDPAVAELTGAQAIGISIGTIVLGWLAYDLFLGAAVIRGGRAGVAAGLALVVGAGFALTGVLAGRAAFLHLGALLGTLMAGNVFRVIIPSQRALVAAAERGERPDPATGMRAKQRSIHNNYLTYPVVALMLSAHFPAVVGHRWNGVLLAIVVLAGVAVRHLMNLRFTWRPWAPALAATVAASLLAIGAVLSLPAPGRSAIGPAPDGPVSFAGARAVVEKRCAVCHSADPADRTFGPSPGGAAFDTPEQILLLAERIGVRAVETETMPPANRTHMTGAERALLARWLAEGARGE